MFATRTGVASGSKIYGDRIRPAPTPGCSPPQYHQRYEGQECDHVNPMLRHPRRRVPSQAGVEILFDERSTRRFNL